MTEEKAIVAQEQKEVDLAEWRTSQEVAVMGKRIKALMPGGDKLSDIEAMALAQYALVMGLNPFRGEVHGFKGKGGQLVIVDGYKALVRWARGKCEYTDRYESAPGIPEDAIGARCFILREDKRAAMRDFVSMGATFKEAYEMCAVYADGIVTNAEMWSSKNKKPINPPTGWTWEQRARTRALKNALNLSHGAPSPEEIATGSWKVNGTETKPEDWEAVTPGMSRVEREAAAEFGAAAREAHEHAEDVTGAQAIDELFGEYPADGDEPIEEAEIVMEEALAALDDIAGAEKETPSPNWVNDPAVTQRFYIWFDKQKLPDGEPVTKAQMYKTLGVTSSLKEYAGTVGEAKRAVKNLIAEWQPDADGLES